MRVSERKKTKMLGEVAAFHDDAVFEHVQHCKKSKRAGFSSESHLTVLKTARFPAVVGFHSFAPLFHGRPLTACKHASKVSTARVHMSLHAFVRTCFGMRSSEDRA